MTLAISLLLVAYLLGAIPSGLWIGKIFYHKNLHELGSGNTGTTNTFRILGTKAGSVVFVLDVAKGAVALLLPSLFHSTIIPALIFGLAAILGHTFSVFDHFKGGKAVATSAGVILAYNPLFVAYLAVIFVIVLVLFSMISLSSISAGIAALLGLILFPLLGLQHLDWLFTVAILAIASLILIRHRENWRRIRAHEENLVPFGFNLSHQKKSHH
ncbi:MAG: glycerol-3-phosphate 1-O-acyltransferase PlsY [Streptococcaceae bacterium]|jgi:glycerol-3-phosphate acyltransferase PlsY|nr:glycerol-3-phosphate 1-O-acyltransferase PlsY [Streptococcaceae bacterium]